MKYFTTIALLLLAITLVQCSIKDRIDDKLNKRHMPEKVEDTAEDVQSGFDHVKDAANAAINAIKEDGITHKVKNAYGAAKDGLKITKDVKDVTVDTQKVGIEGAKDSAKEGVHIYRKHEDTHAKVEDVKQFGQAEIDESKEAIKEGLHGGLKDKTIKIAETVAGGLKGVEETIKSKVASGDHDTIKEAGEKIKSAVGLEDHEKTVGEKIKSAVGLEDNEKTIGEKIKSAVGLEDHEKTVGEKIKSAVGLEETHEKTVGEKIKSAVGLGDDAKEKKHDKKHGKSDKHKKHRDVDL